MMKSQNVQLVKDVKILKEHLEKVEEKKRAKGHEVSGSRVKGMGESTISLRVGGEIEAQGSP